MMIIPFNNMINFIFFSFFKFKSTFFNINPFNYS